MTTILTHHVAICDCARVYEDVPLAQLKRARVGDTTKRTGFVLRESSSSYDILYSGRPGIPPSIVEIGKEVVTCIEPITITVRGTEGSRFLEARPFG